MSETNYSLLNMSCISNVTIFVQDSVLSINSGISRKFVDAGPRYVGFFIDENQKINITRAGITKICYNKRIVGSVSPEVIAKNHGVRNILSRAMAAFSPHDMVINRSKTIYLKNGIPRRISSEGFDRIASLLDEKVMIGGLLFTFNMLNGENFFMCEGIVKRILNQKPLTSY